MQMLLCPNSFKGSSTAMDMAGYLAEILGSIALERCISPFGTIELPVADGGDDTLDVLRAQASNGWEIHQEEVQGPVPALKVKANWLFSPIRSIAAIEAAKAHGIALLTQQALALDALGATSYGVGQLINQAFSKEPNEILIALGGSSSTDAGFGALQAMGVVFLDVQNIPILDPISPAHFTRIQSLCPHSVQLLQACLEKYGSKITILTDVRNPLLGKDGTAYTFAPQKGATIEQCEYLESELSRLASLVDKAFTTDYRKMPGAGAAGGLGYGLLQLPGSKMQSGFTWLSEYLGLRDKLQQADCVVTGEGRFDQTSLQGKATGEVLALAKQYQKKAILLCGSIDQQVLESVSRPDLFAMALTDVVSQDEAIANPKQAVQKLIKHYEKALIGFLTASVAVEN